MNQKMGAGIAIGIGVGVALGVYVWSRQDGRPTEPTPVDAAFAPAAELSRALARRLAERRMTLTLGDAARDLLARKGYDRVYGARPLKRAIQQYIENPLAMEILKGRFSDGANIRADLEGEEIVFTAA